jgi:hypothetical protein
MMLLFESWFSTTSNLKGVVAGDVLGEHVVQEGSMNTPHESQTTVELRPYIFNLYVSPHRGLAARRRQN